MPGIGVTALSDPKSILCIHLNQVGDLLFSFPALHALRNHFPDSHIASLVRPNCTDILMRTSLVNEAIPRPRGGSLSDMRMSIQLRRRKFDLLVLFSTSTATWMMGQISGARVKAGFDDSVSGVLLDIVSPWSPPPSTENNLRLVEKIGCEVKKRDYVGFMTPSDEDRAQARDLLSGVGIGDDEGFAVIGPGTSTGRESKAWFDDGYARVASELGSRFALWSVVVGAGARSGICDLNTSVGDLTGPGGRYRSASYLDGTRSAGSRSLRSYEVGALQQAS